MDIAHLISCENTWNFFLSFYITCIAFHLLLLSVIQYHPANSVFHYCCYSFALWPLENLSTNSAETLAPFKPLIYLQKQMLLICKASLIFWRVCASFGVVSNQLFASREHSWNKLPMEALSLKMFKKCVDVALRDMVSGHDGDGLTAGLDDLRSLFQP